MKRLAVLVPCGEQTRRALAALDLEVAYQPDLEWLRTAEIIIGEPEPELLHQLPALRWLQMTWAGADRYTQMEQFPPHVILTNMSGAYGVTIAEHAMGMLLALCRRLPAYGRQQAQGKWQDAGSEKALFGKHALVLGAGDLGTEIARRCRAFGMYVTGICRTRHPLPSCFDASATLDELDRLLPEADAVLCCLPHTPQTCHALNRRRLAQMKPDAILINVGRGSLIDCQVLAELMQQGHLWGAGLDVTDPEPLPPNSPLWQMENVILTPHVAGVGFGHLTETEEKIWALCLENLRRYLSGDPLKHVVHICDGY